MEGRQRDAQTSCYCLRLCHWGMLQRDLFRVHMHGRVLAYDTAHVLLANVG